MEDGESINVNVPTGSTAGPDLTKCCPYCEPRCPYCGRRLETAPANPYPWPVNPPVYPWPATPLTPYPPWITWTYTGSTTQVMTFSQADLDYARSHPAIL